MPCNLAVSITKAAITEERLRALLTPEAIGTVVLNYLQQNFGRYKPELLTTEGQVLYYRLGDISLTIMNGEVTVDGSRGQDALAERLATNVSALLSAAADRLFQQQVQQALQTVTTRAQSVEVTLEGSTTKAAVFHVNLTR